MIIIYHGNHQNYGILNIFSTGLPSPYDKKKYTYKTQEVDIAV